MSFKQNLIRFSYKFQSVNLHKSFPLDYFIPVYHTVSNDYLPHLKHIINYKNVQEFESDLDFYLKHFQFVDWDEFKSFHQGSFTPKKKIALLTFDDGLVEFHDIISPILERKGIYAINFINPKFIDNKELMFRCKASLLVDYLSKTAHFNPEIFKILDTDSSSKEIIIQKILNINFQERKNLDQIANLMEIDFNDFLKNEKPYLTLNQLKTLKEKGFGISNHGWNHPLYKDLSLNEQLDNNSKSTNYLKENNFYLKVLLFHLQILELKKNSLKKFLNRKIFSVLLAVQELKLTVFLKIFKESPWKTEKQLNKH